MQALFNLELPQGEPWLVDSYGFIGAWLDVWRLLLENMAYREPLPDGCPPPEAEEITGPSTIFRIVWNNPPSDCDFKSQRALYPDRIFSNVSECVARGLSVTSDFDDAMRRTKRRRFRGAIICQLALDSGAGQIQQTGVPPHHTWWPLANFDIFANCKVEQL